MNVLTDNWKPLAAGLAGQYVGPMLPMVVPMDPKVMQHIGVGVGAGLITMDPVVGGVAGAVDYGLCKLYEAVPALDMLTPVRGAISTGTALYVRTML